MIGVILGAVAMVALLAYVYTVGGENAVASYKVKLEAAQQELETANKKALEHEANIIIGMQAQREADEAEFAKKKDPTVYGRVAAERVKYATVFQNPECVLPESSFAVLTAALRGVRTGASLPPESLAPERDRAEVPTPQAPAPGGPPPKPIPRKKAP